MAATATNGDLIQRGRYLCCGLDVVAIANDLFMASPCLRAAPPSLRPVA